MLQRVIAFLSFIEPKPDPLYIDIPLIPLSIHGWTFGLFLPFGYHGQCCYENVCPCSCVSPSLQFVGLCVSMGLFVPFLSPTDFQFCLFILHSYQQGEGLCFSTSFPALLFPYFFGKAVLTGKDSQWCWNPFTAILKASVYVGSF